MQQAPCSVKKHCSIASKNSLFSFLCFTTLVIVSYIELHSIIIVLSLACIAFTIQYHYYSMRFRPLCIDYSTEALQLHRENEQLSGTKRKVIWIKDDNEKQIPQNHNLQSFNTTNSSTNKVTFLLDETTEEDNNTSINKVTPTPGKKPRRWLDDDDDDKEEEDTTSFTARFCPPNTYTTLMEKVPTDDDCSQKKLKMSRKKIDLNLYYKVLYNCPWLLRICLGNSTTN